MSFSGIESRYVQNSRAKIFLFEGGRESKKTVLFLHGVGGASLTSWFLLLPELAQKYHVVAPDMFFANLPDLVGSGYHIRSEDLLVETVVENLPVDKVTIVGLSFGAWPALQMAINHPEKVERLVLISPLGMAAAEVLDGLHFSSANVGKEFYYSIFKHPPPVPGLFLEEHWNRTAKLLNALSVFKPQLVFEGKQLKRGIAKVQCPVLIVHGDEDRIIPKSQFVELAEGLPNCVIAELDDCGHAVVWDQPERLRVLLEDFVSRDGR